MLTRFSLRQQLLLLSSTSMRALAALAFVAMTGINSGLVNLKEVGQEGLAAILALRTLERIQAAQTAGTYEAATWEKHPDAQNAFVRIAKEKKRLDENEIDAWIAYRGLNKSRQETALRETFSEARAEWKKTDEEILDLIQLRSLNQDPGRQQTLFQQYHELGILLKQQYEKNRVLLRELSAANTARTEESMHTVEAATRDTIRLMAGLGVGTFILIFILNFLLSLSIFRLV